MGSLGEKVERREREEKKLRHPKREREREERRAKQTRCNRVNRRLLLAHYDPSVDEFSLGSSVNTGERERIQTNCVFTRVTVDT